MAKDYPVGKAQKTILDALDLTADGFGEADTLFEERGLVVSSRREGRASVPVVTLKNSTSGGFNADGEGETWTNHYKEIDLSKISQWIVR